MQEIGITYISGMNGQLAPGKVLTIAIFYACFYIALYVLRSVGLFVMAKKREIKAAMSNSFGFGGTNSSLILKRYE